MLLPSSSPPLVLKVWGMAFYITQAEEDEWVNLLYAMGQKFFNFRKIMKMLMGDSMYDCFFTSIPHNASTKISTYNGKNI